MCDGGGDVQQTGGEKSTPEGPGLMDGQKAGSDTAKAKA